MARIELRNANVRLVDGYANIAAVNQPSVAPANGDTQLTIDTVGSAKFSPSVSSSQLIPITTRFSVAGSVNQYRVTAVDANAQLDIDLDGSSAGTFTVTIDGEISAAIDFDAIESAIQSAIDAITGVSAGDFEVTKVGDDISIKATADGDFANQAVTMSADLGSLTGGTTPTQTQTHAGGVTHGITFTPALATDDGLPANDAVITFTGRTSEVKVGDGNLEFTENRAYLYDLDRGRLDTVRQDDEVPMDVSLDFVWEQLTAIAGATTPTISDVLHHRAAAADWLSSSADDCEPFALDIEVEHALPCGDEPTEFTVLPDFRWESLPHTIEDAQISMTGRCNATEALISRAAVA